MLNFLKSLFVPTEKRFLGTISITRNSKFEHKASLYGFYKNNQLVKLKAYGNDYTFILSSEAFLENKSLVIEKTYY